MQTPLRKYRTDRKLSLEAMASQFGLTKGQLSRIEVFGTNSLPRALAIAEATNLPVEAMKPVKRERP